MPGEGDRTRQKNKTHLTLAQGFSFIEKQHHRALLDFLPPGRDGGIQCPLLNMAIWLRTWCGDSWQCFLSLPMNKGSSSFKDHDQCLQGLRKWSWESEKQGDRGAGTKRDRQTWAGGWKGRVYLAVWGEMYALWLWPGIPGTASKVVLNIVSKLNCLHNCRAALT